MMNKIGASAGLVGVKPSLACSLPIGVFAAIAHHCAISLNKARLGGIGNFAACF
jgi:hypothetical protein